MSSNIKVAIRIRPLISREKIEKLKEQWDVNENSMYPIDVTTGKRNGDLYHFDHIFDSTYCNADIYSTVVHPVVDKAMNGFNGTIFAYGQTSSGKTYTMMGDANEDGLISLAVQNIFLAIEQSVNRRFLLRVSYMEIYNEKIYDLLDIKNIVKISEDYSGSVVVNVKEEITDCAEKVYDIMKKGNKAKRIGETDLNEKSSRSHTIFRIIIESSDISDTDVVNVAHLNLVDLAGSERAALTKATGQRLKEGAHINKSLSTLSLVMKQLSESQDFINFRDSKLTRILQPSLGGNALTAIICAVTPAALEETHSTLAFASRAKTVKNKPLLNEVVTDEALINRYALEINQLKKDLEMANDKRNLQAQKIAVLEKCILFSKKSNNSNKNRRKTWSAPCDPNRTLPVIYEADVLRLSDGAAKFDNLEAEAFPFKDYPLEADEVELSSEKKKILSWTASSGSESLPTSNESKQSSVENYQPAKKYEDEVKWLVSSTETPKSVLRERAEYYEHEFKSLKELTTKEKLLLTTEYNSDMDSLILQLEEVKNELEYERKLKKEQEIKFNDEKKELQENLDELKKKNDELSKIIQIVKKENEKKTDYEFLVEMYKEKYKKREKELLESLQEARAMQNFNINNTDDEKTVSTDESVPVDMKVFLENCKNQLNILKSELESDQQMSVVQKIFDEIKTLNKEMLTNCIDCPDELQDLLSEFKCMFDLTSIMLSDDTLILELEKDNRQFQHREKTYELLISKDEELKHLSRNILKYMNELAFHKNEVTKNREMSKLDSSSLDLSSIMTNDTKNMTEYDINNSTLNQSDCIFKTDQYTQTEEDFAAIIRLKEKEIEELSDQILEYLDQLTSLEQELNKLKSTSNVEQNNSECKNQEINELNRKIQDYLSQIYKYEEQISEYKAAINVENTLVKDKDEEIRELSEKNKILESRANEEVNNLKLTFGSQEKDNNTAYLIEQINSLSNKLQSVTEECEICKLNAQADKDLIDSKTNKIEILQAKHSEIEEELQLLQSKIEMLKIENDSKDKQIEELNSQVLELTEKMISFQLEIDNNKYNTAGLDLIEVKDNEIVELNKEFSQLKEKQAQYETIIEAMKHQIKEKDNFTLKVTKEKQELEDELCKIENKLKMHDSDEQEKNQHIETLNSQLTEHKEKLSALKDELEIHKLMTVNNMDLTDSKNNKIILNDDKNKLLAAGEKLNKYESDINTLNDLLNSKNQKIEELLSKIMDYTNQLSSVEEKFNKYESDLKDKNDLINSKYEEIEELSSNIMNYINQLSSAEEKFRKCESYLKDKDDLINSKNEEIEKLSSNIKVYMNELSIAEEKFIMYESELKNKNDLVNTNYEEIEELSFNIMDYLNQISAAEEKLKKYESDLVDKNDLINTMTKEIENLSLTIMDYKNQLSAAKEKFNKHKSDVKDPNDLMNTKNREIEELSCTIMNYKNQLSAAEEKLNKHEFDLKDQNDLMNTKNREIEELSCTIMDYKNQLSAAEEKLNKHESDLNDQNDLMNTKNREIEELSCTIMDYKKQLSAAEEKLNKHESDLNDQNDLMNTKNREIEELSCTIMDYKKQLSAAEEKLNKHESDLKDQNDLMNTKNREIEELSCTIMDYKNQLSAAEEKLNKHESDLKDQNDLMNTKNREIEELSCTIMDYKNQLSAAEEKLNKHESDLNDQNDLMNTKNREIEELSCTIMDYKKQLSAAEEKLNKHESDLKDQNDLMNTKNREIEELSCTIMDYKNQLSALEQKSKNYESDLKVQNDAINEYINQIIALEEIIYKYNMKIASKDKEIQELSSKVAKYENQFILTKEDIMKYKTVIEEKTNLLELQNKENEDLTTKLNDYEKRIFNLLETKKLTDYQIQELQSEKFEFDNKIIRYKEKISNLKSANISEKAISHDLSILQSKLAEKENIISQQDSDINQYKVLNKKLTKQLMELYTNIINMSVYQTRYEEESGQSEEELLHSKFTQISSEFEKLSNKLHVEETKSMEYFNKIKILDEKLQYFSEQTNQVKTEQCSALNENLQKQICVLQEQLNQHELTLKKYKDYIDQLEAEKIELQEKNTLLRNTNMMEKQEMTVKLQEKCKYIEKLQKELVNVNNIGQNNNTDLTKEMAKLKKKNEDYKKIVEQVTEKANSKIAAYNNIVVKLKQDNELLKAQIKIDKESHQTLQHKVVILQGELDKKTGELSSGSEIANLQVKVNSLNAQNKKLAQVIEDYQEQVYKKGYEVSAMKKSIEVLKYENTDLQKVNKELNSKLCETEVLLKSTQTNLQLLEKEKEKYSDSSRVLEESLEDVKFELYELKNKERERIKKIKRQSLQDSSRSLSSDEQSVIDENQQTHSDSSKSKTVECEICKVRMPLSNRPFDEFQFSKLQIEYEHMRKKNEQLTSLCKIRRNKIDELERQIQSSRTQ